MEQGREDTGITCTRTIAAGFLLAEPLWQIPKEWEKYMQYWYTTVSGVVDMSIVFVYFGTVNRSCPSRPPGFAAASPGSFSSITGLVARNIYKKQCFYRTHITVYWCSCTYHCLHPQTFSAHLVPALAPGVQETMSWLTSGKGRLLVFYPEDSNSNRKSSRNGSGAIFSLT